MSQITYDGVSGSGYEGSNYASLQGYYGYSPPIISNLIPFRYYNKATGKSETRMMPSRATIPFRSAYDTLDGENYGNSYQAGSNYFDLAQAYKSR